MESILPVAPRCNYALKLFRCREMYWPTGWGWLLLVAVWLVPVGLVVWKGEAFLATTRRVPADVLVVEGWIGREAIEAAAQEFRSGQYDFVVATGGFTSTEWAMQSYSYAGIAARELRRAGVPADRILLAPAPQRETQRTFAAAVAVRQALGAYGMTPRGMNIFTRATHARRSLLVNAKVEDVPVGAIGWIPDRERTRNWWGSTERAKDLLTESVSLVYEAVLNSGRLSNSPPPEDLLPIAEGPANEEIRPDGAQIK